MNEECSKEVIRVERWGGRIIVDIGWRTDDVYNISIAPQTGRTQEDKDAF